MMEKNYKKNNSGFTLIETIIYIAILAFVMGAGITAAFYILDSGQKNKTDINTQAEGQFLLRKIEWAFSGAVGISVSSGTLSVTKDTTTGFPASQNPLVFSLSGSNLQLKRGSVGSATNLNSSNVTVSNLVFQQISGTLQGVTVSFTLSAGNPPTSKVFTMTKYLRK